MSKEFRWPSMKQRLAVIGKTGSGKTRFGVYALSKAPMHKIPYVIIDYKRDELISEIPYVEPLELNELPKYPGLYHLKPNAGDDVKVDHWLRSALKNGNIGVFVDEGLELPQREPRFVAFKNMLSQGRSKNVPVIICMQRPAWVNRSIFSESDFFAVFHMQADDDQATVRRFTPKDWELSKRLDDFHSRWYDVGNDTSFVMKPVPADDIILEDFEKVLKPKRNFV